MREVLVHSCFRAVEPFAFGIGKITSQQIFHRMPNGACGCAHRISFRERDAKLALDGNGAVEAYVLVREKFSGVFFPEWREIVLVGKSKGPPWVKSVSAADMDVAYVQDVVAEQERINEYGAITRMELVKLGARLVENNREKRVI